jgi:recombination protein RecT
MGTQIVKKEDNLTAFKRSILSEKAMSAIATALPEHLNPQKMARVVITAVTRTPKLLECRPETVMNAVIEASQLGLMVDGVLGHGYLVPYKTTCVFIPGYKGLLDLARRSGEIAWVNARVVYQNDEFDFGFGMEPRLNHTPARSLGKEPGPMIAAYGIAKYKDGEFHFEVMYKDDIEAIRKRSRAGNDGPWVTDYEEMARKTVIRRLCKYLPMNPEYQQLVARDEYHEAGVLGKYIDVDPATGEVIDTPEEQTGDMLDLFAEKLEEEKEEEISDPRFEGEDDQGDGDAPAAEEREEAPDPTPEPEDSGEDETEEGSNGGDDGGAGDDEDLKQDGTGRISKEEEAAFAKALEKLQERMLKVQDQNAIDKLINNRLGMFGAEKPAEIRSREERVKFYTELKQMCEQWESYAKPAMRD